MNWFLPALCATVLWGFGQTFIKRGLSGGTTPFISNLFIVISQLAVGIPFALLGGIQWSDFPAIFVFGLLASLPNFVFPYILQKANVSLSGTVLATYPIYTVILSIIFLKESLDPIQVLGVLGIICGTFLIAAPENGKFHLARWVIWALLGSIVIGFGDFIGKLALTRHSLYSFIIALALSGIISLLFTRLFDKESIKIAISKRDFLFSVIGNFLMPTGLLFLYIAFSRGPASLVSPIASTYPAITVILAFLYLKEKVGRVNLFGILSCITGVILIGV